MQAGIGFLRARVHDTAAQHGALIESMANHECQADNPRIAFAASAARRSDGYRRPVGDRSRPFRKQDAPVTLASQVSPKLAMSPSDDSANRPRMQNRPRQQISVEVRKRRGRRRENSRGQSL